MYYGQLNKMSIVDGLGIRVSLYVSGCSLHCPGCHNQKAWNFKFGNKFTDETIKQIIEYLKPYYIKGLSILGGEPMDKNNQKEIKHLIKEIKKVYGNSKDIWLWTGYELEDLKVGGKQRILLTTNYILKNINYIVTGPFKLELRDISKNNLWRGSTNQKVIKLR